MFGAMTTMSLHTMSVIASAQFNFEVPRMKTLSATAMGIAAIILLCALSTGGQQGQEKQQQRTKIYVEARGSDAVGIRFAFALKEDINRSSNYQVTGVSGHSLRVLLGSRDVGQDINGKGNLLTAVSMVLLVDTTSTCSNVLASGIYLVGTDRVNEMAQTMLADIDHYVSICGDTPLATCQTPRGN
jgi:hypothetical protein